ncbi:AAA family ATPase [Geodermatophilus sp. SYSU D00815]
MLVGRAAELAAIAATLDDARAGRCRSLVLEGEAGVGKTTLLDAAAVGAEGFRCLRTTGVEAELGLGHAGLLDLLAPLRDLLPALPPPQQRALTAALGWADGPAAGERFLVSAATMGLLARAAEDAPVAVVVDDVQWVDLESVRAVAFAARRLRHDRVALVLARRPPQDPDADELADLPRCRLAGLAPAAAAELLGPAVAPALVEPLVAATAGNPLALVEATRALTAEQRRGSAPLPDVLPLGDRLAAAADRLVAALGPGARRAVTLAALSAGSEAGPVVTALRAAGEDADASLAEAERGGVLVLGPGTVAFAHPLLRSAVLRAAPPGARRAGHAALAAALADDPDRALRHRAQAVVGADGAVADRLEGLAARERVRRGFAAASQLQEQAARLHGSAAAAAGALALAVEDAFLAGDPARVRSLAAQVLAGAGPAEARGRVLLCLGTLEHYAGSVPAAPALLREAAACTSGAVRLRALTELGVAGYRLASPATVAEVADEIAATADRADPEQAALADYARAHALALAGDWAAARPLALRAFDVLEGEPSLRDEPRYLIVTLLAAGWANEIAAAEAALGRRLTAARAAGALGVLPPVLSLVAAGVQATGDHRLAYAAAGEAVELGAELGYVADVATAHELLAWEEAARGRHAEASRALAAARDLGVRAGVAAASVHVHLVDAFAALCRGDLRHVVDVLERRIAADGGRLPRGDYELSVAPDLVEAYLGLGRRADAVALAARHAAVNRDSPMADVRAHVERLTGLLADDEARADAAFERAHEEHAAGFEPFEAARTRLLHGGRLRRAGRRVEARRQLERAAEAFDRMGVDGWARRARDELAATGARARRGGAAGDELTSQETRVALLVAQGLTNKDIAAALFLSPKTVEHHLTSILRKRRLRSRAAIAAAFAGR